MSDPIHIRHYHRHVVFSYPVSLQQRIYSLFLLPLLLLVLILLFVQFAGAFPLEFIQTLPLARLLGALLATVSRLFIAFVFALIASIPLALLITTSQTSERFLLPLFDIIQSVPVLAFFPVIIVFFVNVNFLNGAAIFILFLGMLWNLVFNLVAGIKVIPSDIKDAATVMHITGLSYLDHVLIPAILPYLITGSLLAFAQGWNITIVAEVLHTYIPGATSSQDLFGLGSLLVNSVAHGDNALFVATLCTMVVAIALFNFFVWQKLLHYAQRYKFE